MRVLFSFLSFLSSIYLFATEQIKDSLVYNGKGYLIENQFLFEEELSQFVDENKFYDFDYPTSALWRGYRAVFEVVENKIRLKDIGIIVFYEQKNETGFSFTNYRFESVANEEILKKANLMYFDGVLVLADGYLVEYSFFYDDYNPNYKVLEFNKSLITKELDFKFDELDGFKSNQFENYKNTKFYRKDLRKCRKRNKELIKSYKKDNMPEMVQQIKQYKCEESIRRAIFLNPFYTKVL